VPRARSPEPFTEPTFTGQIPNRPGPNLGRRFSDQSCPRYFKYPRPVPDVGRRYWFGSRSRRDLLEGVSEDAIDAATGQVLHQTLLGVGYLFNTLQLSPTIVPGEVMYQGTVTGILRISPAG
jgi:hypothetical protein